MLERHLLVRDDNVISFDQLQTMNGQTLRTVRGELGIEVKDSKFIEKNGFLLD